MKRFPWQAVFVVVLAVFFTTWQGACGAEGSDSAWDPWDASRDGRDASGWDTGPESSGDASDTSAETDTWLPPEDEVDPDFHAPQGSNRFVYLSNPLGDNVVVIDSSRLTLDLVEVGDTPTELATLGMNDAAAVIDSGSNDVAVIRTRIGEPSDVTFEPIAPGANAISVSPDGRYGVTYYDVDARRGERPPNMQEVTLLVFEPTDAQQAVRTTVRSLPVTVDWTADSTQAFVIGWDGLTVIDFPLVGEGYRPTHISFGTVPSDPANPESPRVAREVDNVDVSGDGSLAVLSKSSVAEILILDIETAELTPIPLPAAPTDVDLSEDGAFALAALRETGQVARIDLTAAVPDVLVTDITGVIAGQVTLTPEGDRAIVFSTAADQEVIALLDMVTGDSTVVPLQKKVRAVAASPDGSVAVVIHQKKGTGAVGDPYLDPDDPALDPVRDLEEIIDRTYGFSLVRFSDLLVVRQETPCDPGAWLVYPEAQKAFLTLRNDDAGVRQVLVADLVDFITDTVTLGSPPVSLGLAPLTRKVFVGQEHAMGRITFIATDGGPVQTITGFELNDWIME